jgi:tetratricopeptide (TPR) repeat protein
MSKTRVLLTAASVPLIALVLLVTGAFTAAPPPAPAPQAASAVDVLGVGITTAERRVHDVPRDARAWAGLALLYVTKAEVTGDPAWYRRADGAVARSLRLDARTNDAGFAAQAAVAAARHDFPAALAAARRGLAVNRFSASLNGTLVDALVQLGRYEESTAAVERLNRLHPGVPAFARVSYDRELHGDIGSARTALEQALRVAVSPADKAFARTYLGELALAYQGGYGGTPAVALEHFDAGLRLVPSDPGLRDGRARALVALGRVEEALEEYAELVSEVPEPPILLGYAELLQSLQSPQAQEQYAALRVQEERFAASGARADVEATLFEADHGSPAAALRQAKEGWRTRPFLEMADAYAWALYRNHRYAEALAFSDRALATGRPSALARFHRGMIEKALGRDEAARRDLQAALRLNPSFHPLHVPEARRALVALAG